MSDQRPRPKSKYPAPFSLRLSKEERKELKRLAQGRPLGEFIKDALFNKKLRPPKSRKAPALDQQLLGKILGALGQSRIANNINQLARAANSGSLPVNEDVLKSLFEAVRAIEWMRKRLIEGMGIKAHSSREANENNNDS